jgi:hypothetical protein
MRPLACRCGEQPANARDMRRPEIVFIGVEAAWNEENVGRRRLPHIHSLVQSFQCGLELSAESDNGARISRGYWKRAGVEG